MARSSLLQSIGAAVLVAWLCCQSPLNAAAQGGDTEKIRWKSVPVAQLKLDGKTPLAFNIYQPDKKKESNLVLILLGHRYLLLDTKAKLVYSVLLTDLHATGEDWESGDLAQASRVVPSSEWVVRDVGPAESIKLTLGDYGRAIEIQLPHMPDLRRGIY
jgi:hypothetical protein